MKAEAIEFFVKCDNMPELDFSFVRSAIIEIIEYHNKQCGEISLVFCDDKYILEINRNYLKHDYYTDIITFDYSSVRVISGDLIISVDTVISNSLLFEVDSKLELHRVIFHGVLHLLGFDDKTEEEERKMRSLEDYWLEHFSL